MKTPLTLLAALAALAFAAPEAFGFTAAPVTVERQLVVHVRTATAFTPQWLTTKECG